MTDFTKVPLGTTVYSANRGKGRITESYENCVHPINVSFENGTSLPFTKDGRLQLADVYPTLYLNPIKVVEDIVIEMDTPVWVKREGERCWTPRHATGKFTKEGKIICWIHGRTSHTTAPFMRSVETVAWDTFRLTAPECGD